MTHQQIAQGIGKSRTTVTNLLRLLELNADVKKFIEERCIEMGHARALLGLQGQVQSDAARQVVAQGFSVRETEKLVRRLQGVKAEQKEKVIYDEDPDVRLLENSLIDKLGARVKINKAPGQRQIGDKL